MRPTFLRLSALPALTLGLLSCRQESHPVRPPEPKFEIAVVSDMPADVPGGAEHADLRTASQYAWQEFIAMNWPAKAGVRDTPDPQSKFGQPVAPGGALVSDVGGRGRRADRGREQDRHDCQSGFHLEAPAHQQ